MGILRILHVNLFDALGGAAKAAWTLMNHMTKQGHDVHIFAHRKTTDDPRVIPLSFPSTGWQKKLLTQQGRQGLFDVYSAALLQVLEHPLYEQADILHLHCINGGYFSFLLLPFLTAKPTIWTLHDPLAFTAGCYNTDDCNGWQHDWCATCPLDKQGALVKPQRELMQLLKTSIYKIADFTAVSPSKWLQKQAKASILQNHDVRLIPYGIDMELFCPGNKHEIRGKLGLPLDQQIVMFAAHGGLNDPRKGGKFLIAALQKIYQHYPKLMLLNVGTFEQSIAQQLPIKRIDLPFINDPGILADYYRAADLFVAPSLAENVGLTIIEASACGTPVVAFATGGIPEVVVHLETGYLAERGNSDDLAQGMVYFLGSEEAQEQASVAGRRRMVERFSDQRMVDDYITLYEEIQRKKGWNSSTKRPAERPKDIDKFVEKAKIAGGWDFVWHEFWQIYKEYAPQEAHARNKFVDEFYTVCLQQIMIPSDNGVLWKIIEEWAVYRYMPGRSGGLLTEETQALFEFSCTLREKIHQYIVETDFSKQELEVKQETAIVNVWWHVFLNYFSGLNLTERHQSEQQYGKENVRGAEGENKYARLLLASLYDPFHAEKFDIDIVTLWQEKQLPTCYKVILSFWFFNIPYYSIEEQQHQRLLQVGENLSHITVPSLFLDSLVSHISNSFWIASYAGGNHRATLTSFGDFITNHMSRFFPQYSLVAQKQREHKQRDKVRIGYLSRCFYNQSVSYYMVNRVIHHDRNKFEVYVFAIGDRNDEMTQLFSRNSTHFHSFTNLSDLKIIAQSIVDSQLDILIYTEIGMDPVTYLLAGMQLAPIQCAMVGHGTTTGLSTIQYYLSGDFEPSDGELHYREKLIRLPSLGAAQYPPPLGSSMPSTRKDWKIPEDAILFVSCANGIKHVPSRDRILVEILAKIPNACIALKPHSSYDTGNELETRIMDAAGRAGVEKRLFIVPPLTHVGPLLAIADIQLDTYPYGGWTTNMEALYVGLPIITQEGEMARSRWGAFMLRALGVPEGIAESDDEYVEWAVRFALDLELRQQVKKKIIKNGRQVLFNGAAAQRVYEKTLLKIFMENQQ